MKFSPRDIIRREGTLYIVEQVVEDDRGSQLLVKELDGDSRWVFGTKTCERIATRKVNKEQEQKMSNQ